MKRGPNGVICCAISLLRLAAHRGVAWTATRASVNGAPTETATGPCFALRATQVAASQIDRLVYELYELTDEGIRWGSIFHVFRGR